MTDEEKQIAEEERQRWLSMPIAYPWKRREMEREVIETVKTIMASLVTSQVRYEVEINPHHSERVRVYLDMEMLRGGFEVDTYYLMKGTNEQRRGLLAHHLYATLRKVMEAAYLR